MPFIIEAEQRRRRPPLAAVVPIAVALVGVAMIGFGGGSASDQQSATAIGVEQPGVDPVTTGSIPERDRAYDLMMLDR